MLNNCPGCGADQIQQEIPAEVRCDDTCSPGVCKKHFYKKEQRFFYKTVGFYALDVTLFYFCPACKKAAWHRWPEGSDYRKSASVHMRREGFTVYPSGE